MKFLDEAKIYLQSGNGGPGCVSFRREKYVEFGGPDGGNGGRGGDVIFEAHDTLNTLIDFRYQQHFKAQHGEHGKGANRTGAGGNDCIIKIPVGTQIMDEDKETILADFTENGQRMIFLKGGDGGFGNTHYKSATNQAPRKSLPGWPGQEAAVWLRLKLIADVGLVGLPNAGKSTFLAACSNAKPKIADYPFTTLHPNLGMVKAGEIDFIMADIPGLIEGAHEGKGLGTRFLGHVERTSVLLHLVDITDDQFVENYFTIREELTQYGSGLEDKHEIVAVNKIDALSDEDIEERVAQLQAKIDKPIEQISAVAQIGTKDILFKLAQCVQEHKNSAIKEDDDAFDYTDE